MLDIVVLAIKPFLSQPSLASYRLREPILSIGSPLLSSQSVVARVQSKVSGPLLCLPLSLKRIVLSFLK